MNQDNRVQSERHGLAMVLDGERSLLKRFLDLLDQEETLLIAGDTDALMPLAKEKGEVYRLLQRHHDSRGLLLGRLGMNNTDADLRQACAAMPDALARWDEILQLAEQARTRNELNGKLIIQRMHTNQAALSVLLTAANKPQLYDAAGTARPAGGGRMLGSA